MRGPAQTATLGFAMTGWGCDLTNMVEKRDKKTAKARPRDQKMTPGQQTSSSRQRNQQPEWANGLRRLYNSVVEEPLPDSFADLIAKLDSPDR